MTTEQIKKYLMGIESEKRCLVKMAETIERYREKLSSPPSAGLAVEAPRVQGSKRNALEDGIVILCELGGEYDRRLAALLAREGKVYKAISCLDPCEQEIIIHKYLHSMTWDEVGAAVHYSPQHARRLNRKAIELMVKFEYFSSFLEDEQK